MAFDFIPLTTEREPELRRLLADPSIASEFDILLDPGQIAHKLEDTLLSPAATWLASERGEPAGMTIGFLLPQAGGIPRGALRLAVGERFRRRGLGTALLARAAAAFAAAEPRPTALDLAAWMPAPEAEAFVARHGYAPVRTFWRMSRPPRPAPEPQWPAGVSIRAFDRSERAFEDWHHAYNASFAGHWRYVPSTMEQARAIAADPLFPEGGLLLVSRDARCVGFCRNERLGGKGVVGTIGVVPEARGIGLGRAMLRWAINYFVARECESVGLLVDGENESALELYRSEGFEIARTRRYWSRAL